MSCSCLYEGNTFNCPLHSHQARLEQQVQSLKDELKTERALVERYMSGDLSRESFFTRYEETQAKRKENV